MSDSIIPQKTEMKVKFVYKRGELFYFTKYGNEHVLFGYR